MLKSVKITTERGEHICTRFKNQICLVLKQLAETFQVMFLVRHRSHSFPMLTIADLLLPL